MVLLMPSNIDDSTPTTNRNKEGNNEEQVIVEKKVTKDYDKDEEEEHNITGSVSASSRIATNGKKEKEGVLAIGEVGRKRDNSTEMVNELKGANGKDLKIKANHKEKGMLDAADGDKKQKGTHQTKALAGANMDHDSANRNIDKSAAASRKNKTSPTDDSSAGPPPPLLKGTLTCKLDQRKHILRGMWNYDYTNTPADQMPKQPFPAQQFELIRTFPPEASDSEILIMPSNGTFNGSFSLCYFALTKNGKTRERSKIVPETGVAIKFDPIPNDPDNKFDVSGRGTNEFGEFDVYGTASRSNNEFEKDTFHVELRKKYVTPATQPEKKKRTDDDSPGPLAKKLKTTPSAITGGKSLPSSQDDTLPSPSPSYPSGVVCMRGKLFRVKNQDIGVQENLHRVRGLWSSGLDSIQSDPRNERGACNEFLYEHKSIAEKCDTFPLSGRYTGWFDLTGEGGAKSRISEKDVSLKFRPNNANGYNVEGKGSNVFGKYSITGTLEPESDDANEMEGQTWLFTIFKHFLMKKQKKQKTKNSLSPKSTSVPAETLETDEIAEQSDRPFTLDDVVIPGLAAFKPTPDKPTFVPKVNAPPAQGSYTALSRGVLRVDHDGAHTCGGKWAITREHFTNQMVSNFHFGLEAQLAVETTKAILSKEGRLPANADTLLPAELPKVWPIDSAHYKGSFKMKRGATKYSSVVDNQIVLKFLKNDVGGYNVHGKGSNSLGKFNLVGTLIPQGESTGVMELYRIYSENQKSQERPVPSLAQSTPMNGSIPPAAVSVATAPSSSFSGTQPQQSLGFQRTESGRSVKLPPRLEEADPHARMARLMDKCGQILSVLQDQDRAKGGFFSEPVDPVALGIPNYHSVIANPMDLGTIQHKLAAGEITTPEEFAKLVRLVFKNAMRFNEDPNHSVHSSALNMLILFNRKFGDVERLAATTFSSVRRPSKSELKSKQREEKKKQKDTKEERRKKQKDDKISKSVSEHGFALPVHVQDSHGGDESFTESAPEGYIAKAEFENLKANMAQMQQMLASFQQQLLALESKVWTGPSSHSFIAPVVSDTVVHPLVLEQVSSPAFLPSSSSADKRASKSKSKKKEKSSPEVETVEEGEVEEEEKPLTIEEQEKMTEIINDLGGEHLNEVIKIIREGTKLGDEDEIDLEIDLLPVSTQRKLQHYVLKVIMFWLLDVLFFPLFK